MASIQSSRPASPRDGQERGASAACGGGQVLRERRGHGVCQASSAALLLACVGACAAPRSKNVILIVMDTVRADHLGAYGYTLPTSEAIDRWAKQGLIFEHAFAPSPWTLPTFGSIISGQLPGAHLAGRRPEDREDAPAAKVPFGEGAPTLARELGDAGFATAAFVSSNGYLKPSFGIARGFATYDWASDRADQTVDRALAWVGQRHGERFFLLMHLMDPHMPYRAPEPLRGRFSAGGAGKIGKTQFATPGG